MSLQAIRLEPCLANVFDLRGPDFLLFYTILLLLGAAFAFAMRQLLRGPGDAGVDLGKGGALHPTEVAYLAGGPRAAIDAATAALVQREVLTVSREKHYLQPRGGPPPQDLHPLEKAIFDAVSVEGGKAVGALRRDVKAVAEHLTSRLQSLELSPAPERRFLIRAVPMFVMLAVFVVGVVKVLVGLDRNRPVAFLGVLCFATVVAAVAFAAVPAHRTRKGAAFLRRLRELHAPLRTTALHAPPTGYLAPADLALAFALFGPAMLVYGPVEHLRRALLPPKAGGCGGGSGCGSGSCGGGGGCGGGGCGGCGGG